MLFRICGSGVLVGKSALERSAVLAGATGAGPGVSRLVVGLGMWWVMRPGRAGPSGARSRAVCTALLGGLIRVSVRMVDTILGLAGLVGN